MKVQRLIEKYKKLEGVWDAEGAELARQIFLQDLEQLDEPEKVTIPQSVADWIRKCKTFKSFAVSLSFALQPSVWEANGLSDESIEWLANAENQEIFARAWLSSYEIEEEKRYRVRFKGLDKDLEYLNFKHGHVWVFSDNIENEEYRTCHTRKELKDADFGWVFDCPGVEVEEVKD
jgi:hypothetical protein